MSSRPLPRFLTINGEARALAAPATVAALLEDGPDRQAAGGGAQRRDRAEGLHAAALADGDRLEIVVAVGGG
jgi:sulfur carrier protein ThiS